jgi:hypothetical protein
LIPALALYADQHKWELVVAARINCLGLITTPVSSHGASTNCLSWSAQVQQHLLAPPRLDAVMFPGYRYAEDFLAGTHATAEEAAAAQQQVLATWSTFAARGTRVVVPEDVPGMRPTSDPVCLAQTTSSDDPCSRPRTDVVRPSVVSTWAQQRADLATFVPTAHYFCDAVTCHAVIGGVVVYFDSHHLTTTYARSLARYLGADVAAAISARPAVKPVRGD